jgi:hypothetical protein
MKTASKTTQYESIKAGTNHIKMLIGVGILIASFIIFSGHSRGAATNTAKIVTYPVPAGEVSSSDYQVQVSGRKIDTYMARVLDPPFAGKRWDFGGPYSFANFDMSGSVVVRITSGRSLRNVVIRPQSYGIKPTLVNDHTLTLTLDRPLKFSVEPDGKKGPLLLFANPIETDAPKAGDENVVYFGPGVHKPEKIVLGSNQTLYLDSGRFRLAVAKGSRRQPDCD